jgi:acetyl-CoA acetyltransferase
MTDVFICDYLRTPIGRFGGALAMVRTDDLAAVPLRALMARNAGVDWAAALIPASAKAVRQHRLTPIARVLGRATAGVEPRIMGIGAGQGTANALERV